MTADIHHVLQNLSKLTTYIVHVSATLDDGGETDISEIEFETGKIKKTEYSFWRAHSTNPILFST